MNILKSVDSLIKETETYPVQYPSSYPPPYPVQSGYLQQYPPLQPRPRRRIDWGQVVGGAAARAAYKTMVGKSHPQTVGQFLTDPRLYTAALGGAVLAQGINSLRKKPEQ